MENKKMKTIRCAKCENNVQVEDDYQNKCCPICLAKRKASYEVERTEQDLEGKSKKELERLGLGNRQDLNFGEFREKWKTIWHTDKEITWEEYIKIIQETAVHRIQSDADEKVRDIKGEKAKRIRYNGRFLDFGLYPSSSVTQCTKFRHQIMGSYPQDLQFLEDHRQECPECKMWEEIKDSGMLNAEGSSEIWHGETEVEDTLNLGSPCSSEKCERFRTAYISWKEGNTNQKLEDINHSCESCKEWIIAYRISIGEIKRPRNLDEYEEEHFGKEVQEERQDQPQQQLQPVGDPYLRGLQEEHQEGTEETDRINKLSDRKIKEFLDRPDEE